jgi:hypothetical protein
MPSVPLVGKVLVSIVSAIVKMRPPAWYIEYDVNNLGGAEIWLVVDESLVLRLDEAHIELSYARGKMQPGVQVFGYFNPNVVNIQPGRSLRRSVEITWPCRLSDIWNAQREATPSPGEYEVSVRVGFAMTAAPNPPKVGEDVETPVLRWQKETVSPPVRIAIPLYTP